MTKGNRMYPFVTETYNPIGGVCPFNCVYCWAKDLIKRYGHKKYSGKYYLIKGALEKKFKSGSFVFLCDMLDLFAPNVPSEIIRQVLEIPRNNPYSKFLLETKNPKRYLEFLNDFPDNVVLGVTIESNLNYPQTSKAPPQEQRISYMLRLKSETKLPLFISIEPILYFDYSFINQIGYIKPWAVAVGYDNYNHKLPEPSLYKTQILIEELRKFTTVYKKTIHLAWWEK